MPSTTFAAPLPLNTSFPRPPRRFSTSVAIVSRASSAPSSALPLPPGGPMVATTASAAVPLARSS
jgi:hypothetical protein